MIHAEGKFPLLVGFTCHGMQIAINSSSCCCQSSLVDTLVDSMAVDNMVLARSSVALVGMDHNKNRDRSSSLLKREPKLP